MLNSSDKTVKTWLPGHRQVRVITSLPSLQELLAASMLEVAQEVLLVNATDVLLDVRPRSDVPRFLADAAYALACQAINLTI